MNVQTNDMVLFEPSAIATIGNRFLAAIVSHELAVEDAQAEIQRGAKREQFIDMEMTKAMMFLHSDADSGVDLYRVYGDKKESEILFRSVLVAMGVTKKIVTKEDKVEYEFTDATLKDAYYFPAAMNDPKKLGEDDVTYTTRIAEFTKRRSRRNALNIRLNRCVKAAIALAESGANAESIVYRENDNGSVDIVLTAGPKAVMGDEKEVVIVTGNTAKVKGASQTPTLSGIVKVADDAHKEKPAAKADSGEGATRKATDGDTTANENDFLAMVNAMLMTIRGRENVFQDAEKAALRNLLDEIAAVIRK